MWQAAPADCLRAGGRHHTWVATHRHKKKVQRREAIKWPVLRQARARSVPKEVRFLGPPSPFSALPGSGVGSGRFGPGRSLGCSSLAPYRGSVPGSVAPWFPLAGSSTGCCGAAGSPRVGGLAQPTRSQRYASRLSYRAQVSDRWRAQVAKQAPGGALRPCLVRRAHSRRSTPPSLSVGRRCAPSAHRRGWRGRPGSPGPSCAGLAVGACLPFRRAPWFGRWHMVKNPWGFRGPQGWLAIGSRPASLSFWTGPGLFVLPARGPAVLATATLSHQHVVVPHRELLTQRSSPCTFGQAGLEGGGSFSGLCSGGAGGAGKQERARGRVSFKRPAT